MSDKVTPIDSAQLQWDENGLPTSSLFDDIYFSKENGLAETEYVFLQHNQLPERFALLKADDIFTIAETGFGTGLNFLATWRLWQKTANEDAVLHYLSVEKYPLKLNDLKKALALWPELQGLANELIKKYPKVNSRGFHRLKLGNVVLTLIFDDAQQGLAQLLPSESISNLAEEKIYHWSNSLNIRQVDAWFLDGFAPAKNPRMWSAHLFQTLAQLSSAGTTLATFTCAAIVKNGLKDAGFQLQKTKGFGRKREMLCAYPTKQKDASTTQLSQRAQTKESIYWHLMDFTSRPQEKDVAIIGAGLAGAHSAFALANRGYRVTMYDKQKVASGASGNPVGIVYSKLSHTPGPYADFNLSAYLHALQFYQDEDFFASLGQQCGVYQLLRPEDQDKNQIIKNRFADAEQFVQFTAAQEHANYAGVNCKMDALHFPMAGWLSPAKLCHQLLSHKNIRVIENTPISKLESSSKAWLLHSSNDASVFEHQTVIIANAQHVKDFQQTAHLPAKGIRGQISYADANPKSQTLNAVICHESYIAPAANNTHCLGATYDLNSCETDLRWDDHHVNLNSTAAISPNFADLSVNQLESGRASVRCSTLDYLPVVGPAPKYQNNIERFSAYRANRKATIAAPGSYYPNLYVHYGHGSKGLTYTPLCAELLACMLTGEPLPLARETALNLHPLRFLIRDLARNRV